MWSDVVILPSALSDSTGSLDVRASLIADLKDGAVLLVDADAEGVQAIFTELNRWPPAHGMRAKKAIVRLAKLGRVVRVPISKKHRVECRPECSVLHTVARASTPAIRFCGDGCCAQDDRCRSVNVTDYVASGAADDLRATSIQLTRKRHTVEDLERAILPFVRRAQSVTIFDRNLGRSASDAHVNQWDRLVAERWNRSLRTILGTFQGTIPAASLQQASATIVTGVWDDADPEIVADDLRAWAAGLTKALGFPVTVEVRLESRAGRRYLEHDRYLITAQGALNSSRGFDLVFTDRQMRDAGLDPRSDPRPVASTLLSLVPTSVEALVDAKELPEVGTAR